MVRPEESCSLSERNPKQGGQGNDIGEKVRVSRKAAESESHTVVRGYEKGSRVVRMTVTEDGNVVNEPSTSTADEEHH